MKEIKAFIHRNRIADVLHTLKNHNFCSGLCHLSVTDVAGTLNAMDQKEQDYSIEFGNDIITEARLELICENERVDEAITLIKNTAQTSNNLSGWIYVYDIEKNTPIGNKDNESKN